MNYEQMNDWQGRKGELDSWVPGGCQTSPSGLGMSVFGSGRGRGKRNFLTSCFDFTCHAARA